MPKKSKALMILDRVREPSTWGGLSLLLVLFGVPPGVPEAVGQVLAGVAAVASIVMAEGTPDA